MKNPGQPGKDVELVALEKLKAHPRNYREHPDDQIEHIIESIKANGVYRNIVCANDYTVLAGHGVMKACRKMGLKEVPVIRLEFGPDDVRAMKVVTGDNEIGHLGEINDRLLTEILKEIKEQDERGLLGTGYDEKMLASLLFVTRPQSEIRSMDAAAHWAGMPDYEAGADAVRLVITFPNAKEQARFVKEHGIRMDKEAKKGTTWSTRWPWTEREDGGAIRFTTEKPSPKRGKKGVKS